MSEQAAPRRSWRAEPRPGRRAGSWLASHADGQARRTIWPVSSGTVPFTDRGFTQRPETGKGPWDALHPGTTVIIGPADPRPGRRVAPARPTWPPRSPPACGPGTSSTCSSGWRPAAATASSPAAPRRSPTSGSPPRRASRKPPPPGSWPGWPPPAGAGWSCSTAWPTRPMRTGCGRTGRPARYWSPPRGPASARRSRPASTWPSACPCSASARRCATCPTGSARTITRSRARSTSPTGSAACRPAWISRWPTCRTAGRAPASTGWPATGTGRRAASPPATCSGRPGWSPWAGPSSWPPPGRPGRPSSWPPSSDRRASPDRS